MIKVLESENSSVKLDSGFRKFRRIDYADNCDCAPLPDGSGPFIHDNGGLEIVISGDPDFPDKNTYGVGVYCMDWGDGNDFGQNRNAAFACANELAKISMNMTDEDVNDPTFGKRVVSKVISKYSKYMR